MARAASRLPKLMTVDEFLDWPGDGSGLIYELVEGELRAQDFPSDAHGTIQSNLNRIIGNHLVSLRTGCRIVTTPGIRPHLRANWNFRVPDLGVTCTANRAAQRATPHPVLLIGLLSPTNAGETWSNVPLYATLPSVEEILVVDTTAIAAHMLRRGADKGWPENPLAIAADGMVELTSIEFAFRLAEAYRDTHLATGT